MDTIIGIDLGTTNSAVAYMRNGESVIVPNLEGDALTPSGVAFVDFPMDHLFGEAHDRSEPGALSELAPSPPADGAALDRAAALLAGARRPVIMAGGRHSTTGANYFSPCREAFW